MANQNDRRQTLRGKFLRVTIPLIFLTVIGVFGVIELMTHRAAVTRLDQTLQGMISTQSAALATPLWNLDHEQIRLSLEAVATNREVEVARIYGEDGTLMREVGEAESAGESSEDPIILRLDIVHDAGAGPKTIGALEFVATQKYVWEQTRLRLMIAGGIALLAVTMEIAAALFALRRIMGIPLEKLLSSINKARAGAGRERVDWASSDELGQVIAAFNEMQEQQAAYEQELREARDTLEKRVDERTSELRAASHEATSARAQLTAAIETISEGFSLYDRDDRLVICNKRYQELLRPEVGRALELGTSFEEIVRSCRRPWPDSGRGGPISRPGSPSAWRATAKPRRAAPSASQRRPLDPGQRAPDQRRRHRGGLRRHHRAEGARAGAGREIERLGAALEASSPSTSRPRSTIRSSKASRKSRSPAAARS